MNSINTVDAAVQYRALGYRVTAIIPGQKRPIGDAWAKRQLMPASPAENVGVLLAQSGVAVLDVDDLARFERALEVFDLTLADLDAAPAWTSGKPNRRKFLFKAPAFPHSTRRLVVVTASGSDVIVELRGDSVEHKHLQDVLPPSRLADGRVYEWLRPLVSVADLPQLPDAIARLWQYWGDWAPALQHHLGCERERVRREAARSTAEVARRMPLQHGASVIELFRLRVDVGDVLARFGYTFAGNLAGRRRWLRPGSTSGIPGCVELTPGKVFTFAGEFGDGHTEDAFGLLTALGYAGDRSQAAAAARRWLNGRA